MVIFKTFSWWQVRLKKFWIVIIDSNFFILFSFIFRIILNLSLKNVFIFVNILMSLLFIKQYFSQIWYFMIKRRSEPIISWSCFLFSIVFKCQNKSNLECFDQIFPYERLLRNQIEIFSMQNLTLSFQFCVHWVAVYFITWDLLHFSFDEFSPIWNERWWNQSEISFVLIKILCVFRIWIVLLVDDQSKDELLRVYNFLN